MKLSTKLLLASILPVISITWWQIKNPLREYGFDWLCYENYSPSCNLYFQSKNCFENPINSGDNENHVFSGSGWLIFGQPLKWELYIDNVSPGDDISFPLERISFYPLLKRRNSKLYGEVTSEVRKEKKTYTYSFDLKILGRQYGYGQCFLARTLQVQIKKCVPTIKKYMRINITIIGGPPYNNRFNPTQRGRHALCY